MSERMATSEAVSASTTADNKEEEETTGNEDTPVNALQDNIAK